MGIISDIIKNFFRYPDDTPHASWHQVAIWFTVLGTTILTVLFSLIFILTKFPVLTLFLIGGWAFYCFYYMWYEGYIGLYKPEEKQVNKDWE